MPEGKNLEGGCQMNKLTLTILTFILVLTFSITLASADVTQLLCLKKGETAEFSKCNPSISDYVCKRTSCQTCVIKKDAGHYCPASQNACNSLGLSCSLLNDTGGTTEVDGDAPNISLFSPIQGEVYPSRSVILNLDIDELATVHYLDNINGRGRWTRVCKDCNEYSRKRSFNEGLNDITIMAEDLTGNIVYEDLSFYIDSKSPKIKRTEPRKGFASGLFEVQFTEENPASLILQYGSFFTGMNEAPLNLEECSIGGTTTSCSAEVNLSSYSGQKIQYWFMLEDMAGSQVISKAVEKTPKLKEGMTLAIEVIYNQGKPQVVYRNDDGWTIQTEDRQKEDYAPN